MIPNNSPWIRQLQRTRPVVPLGGDAEADVAIVGGGIAGMATAFFTLRDTDKSVLLLEADKIAHGATGHNAGQITSYFERPLSDLVLEFGLTPAVDSQRSIESAWALIDEIVAEASLRMPLYRFTGYAGFTSLEQVLLQLKNNRYRVDGGLQGETVVIAEEWEGRAQIPKAYQDLYGIVPHADVLNLLETNNRGYIASSAYQKGCMNSALFTEELVGYLMTKYADRFAFYEGSPVQTVRLAEKGGVLEVSTHRVRAGRIVLCTNGFEHFSIVNDAGMEIDTTFHHEIAGRIGYMSGYLEPFGNPPTAISYFQKSHEDSGDPTGESYFYLTRRPHEHGGTALDNLVCAGGPEKVLPNDAIYSRKHFASEDMRTLIDDFLYNNYSKHPGKETEYTFSWHGLMGYTPSGIRRIGPEPCNPVLLYNLGCNGVGILPSVFGGKRISEFLQGKVPLPSLFDPHDQRIQS